MRRYSVLVAAMLGCLAANLQAKDLYVNAATGNDSVSYANNSAATPWRSLGRAVWGNSSRTAQNSSEAARAGDVVLVAAGTYSTNATTNTRHTPIYNPVNSGTASAPIVIRAQGSVALTATAGAQPIIGTQGRSYIEWDGFTLDEANIPTTADTGPLTVWDSHHVTIKNMNITGRDKNWNDNHVGIRVEQANNITIANNRISGFNDSGMNSACIMTYDVWHSFFEHNECWDSVSGIFIKGDHPGDSNPQHDVVLRFNYIHDVQNAIQFGGVGSTTTSSIAPLTSYVYQNLIVNASLGGVIFIGYDNVTPAKVTVANNTFHQIGTASNNEAGGILLRPGYAGYRELVFRNNLVTSSAAGVAAWETAFNANSSATTFSHNNYYGNGASAYIAYRSYTLSSWQTTFGKDAGTAGVNPLYVGASDFRLASSSPIRTAGLDVLDLDSDGSRTDAIAVGAYITGDEVMGPVVGLSTAAPNPPTNVEVVVP